jgi:malonyl-CoA/methylmalonyl-CoA synthetase
VALPLPPLVARAESFGPRTAIIDSSGQYTYTQLEERSAAISAFLREGRPDLAEDRVAFLAAPGFMHVAAQWGIWRAGGIGVPLPVLSPPADLEFLIRDSGAAIVICDAAAIEPLQPIAERAGIRLVSTTELERAPTAQPDSDPAVEKHRRATMVYTSGTTGRPKGVVATHANIEAQIESLVQAWEWTSADRTLLVLPLHHVHGIINIVGCALWSGAVLEMHPRFDVELAWARMASGELTVFSAVPTIYHRLIQSWDATTSDVQQVRREGCWAMRLMMSGSAALPRQVLERWKAISGHVLLERYGMTEVGMAFSNPLRGERRIGFVGGPLPRVEARLVNERGEEPADGDPGEVYLKGPGVFSEYWQRPEETRDAFADGWFKTGDIAVRDQGSYRLLGRSSIDIIKSGGDKISALEIEEVLRTHPSIAECAVIGVEDAEWGQRVCAAIEARPGCELGLTELREWAKSRMAPYKIPKNILCVSKLPRNAMGKVLKPELATFFAPPPRPERQEP